MNPLSEYLARTGTSQAAFAAKLSRVHGARVLQQQVSRWVCGSRPSRHSRRLIARATRGAIPEKAWSSER